jgi:alpha-glucosidase
MLQTFDEGVALVHPMYYDSPLASQAYDPQYELQYMFGTAIVAAPITFYSDASTHIASKDVWLPSGVWSDWNATRTFSGPVVATGISYGLADIPLFVNLQTLIPMKTFASVDKHVADPLVWTSFLNDRAAFALGSAYEDDGVTNAYEDGSYALTQAVLVLDSTARKFSFTVQPTTVVGDFEMPSMRAHSFQIRGYGTGTTPSSVTCNGQAVPQGQGTPGWYIAETTHSLAEPLGSLVVNCVTTPTAGTLSMVVQ